MNQESEIKFNPNSQFLLPYSKAALFVITLLAVFIFFTPKAMAGIISKPPNNLGLVGYWPFEDGTGSGTAEDMSGNSNDGTLTNMDTANAWISGKFGGALDFGGSTDRVSVSSSAIFNNPNFTYSAWAKTTHSCSGNRYIMSENADGRTLGCTSMGGGVFFVWNNNLLGTSVINDDAWHHVAYTFDGTTGRLYVDGFEEDNSTATVSAGTEFVIAAFDDASFLDWEDGQIDEVRVYNRALSAEEVSVLANSGRVTAAQVPMSDGLVGYWNFDLNKGASTTPDLSVNNNTGNLTGMDPATDYVDSTSGLGQALDFDGSNDYVDLGDVLEFNSTDVSVFAWAFPTNLGAGTFDTIIARGTTNGFRADYGLVLQSDDVVYIYDGASSVVTCLSGTSVSNDVWGHFGFVWDDSAGTIDLYHDGVKVLSACSSQLQDQGSSVDLVTIGAGNFANESIPSRLLKGQIDEVRIYNRALSAEEISRLYKLTQPKVSQPQLSDGLVGYWNFDVGKGAETAYDLSGNKNHGALTNMEKQADWVDSKNAKLGQALDFDGSNDYVRFGSDITLSGEITISLWWKKTNSSALQVAISNNTSGSSNKIGQASNGNMFIRLVNGAASDESVSMPPSDEWNHVVVTRNSADKGDVYLNAGSPIRLFGDATQSGNSNYRDIGQGNNGTFFFDGQIDEVRIYNRALSADEIERLYNMGR